MSYITRKFQEIMKKQRPKLCIMNFNLQKKITFINYLEDDQFYQNIIRKDDT